MEMCYNDVLVMPSNYVVMDQDEMMYVEGGATYRVGLSDATCGRLAYQLTIGASVCTSVSLIAGFVGLALSIPTAGTATLIVGGIALAFGLGAASMAVVVAALNRLNRKGTGVLFTVTTNIFGMVNSFNISSL